MRKDRYRRVGTKGGLRKQAESPEGVADQGCGERIEGVGRRSKTHIKAVEDKQRGNIEQTNGKQRANKGITQGEDRGLGRRRRLLKKEMH